MTPGNVKAGHQSMHIEARAVNRASHCMRQIPQQTQDTATLLCSEQSLQFAMIIGDNTPSRSREATKPHQTDNHDESAVLHGQCMRGCVQHEFLEFLP